MKAIKLFGLVIIGLVTLGVLFRSKQTPAKSGSPPIEYRIVEKWSIPAGGYGRTIVIDSAHRNEADLRRLGEQLRDEGADARHVSIDVYDDLQAAQRRQAGATEELPRDQQSHHDRHRIGVYSRNRGTGSNSWVMALEGMRGEDWPHIEVKY